jgi:propanol-preferring alcohol dehydrogenase
MPPLRRLTTQDSFTVFHSKRLVGSYVGNRQDAFEALQIAADGKVKTHYKVLGMEDLPQVYDDMHKGALWRCSLGF